MGIAWRSSLLAVSERKAAARDSCGAQKCLEWTIGKGAGAQKCLEWTIGMGAGAQKYLEWTIGSAKAARVDEWRIHSTPICAPGNPLDRILRSEEAATNPLDRILRSKEAATNPLDADLRSEGAEANPLDVDPHLRFLGLGRRVENDFLPRLSCFDGASPMARWPRAQCATVFSNLSKSRARACGLGG